MNKIQKLGLSFLGGALIILLGFFFFRPRFAGTIPIEPVAFQIGSLNFFWYGIFLALAVLAGFLLLSYLSRELIKDREKLIDFSLWLVIAGILGARLGFVLQNPKQFFSGITPWYEMFYFWQGGMSIHGALVAGVILVIFFGAKYLKIEIFKLLDVLAPAVILGQVIGRLGNFFNQELFGPPTKVFWKMFVAEPLRPEKFKAESFFHPAFLYELIANLIIFAILIFLSNKKPREGSIFLGYLILYSATRFSVEFFRINLGVSLLNLSLAQWVSLLIIIASGIILFLRARTTTDFSYKT